MTTHLLLVATALSGLFLNFDQPLAGSVDPALAADESVATSSTGKLPLGSFFAMTTGDELRAYNAAQGWRLRFDGRGFEAAPLDGAWTWGLELADWGLAGAESHTPDIAVPTAAGPRVSYDRGGGLVEWYVNEASGLEHGFTLRERPEPCGNERDARLELTLTVRGDLQPRLSSNGRGASFADSRGTIVLTYDGLVVLDADGRELDARLELSDAGLRFSVDDQGARYPLTIDPTAQQAYLKASNTGSGDQFGYSISASGDTLVISAIGEDSNATGVNGNGSDNSVSTAGAAYVFVRNGTTWTQQAYLKASNPDASDWFGYSVSLDDDTLVIGAPYEDSNATGSNGNDGDNSLSSSGAAYVFVRNGSSWSQQAYLKASNTGVDDSFGLAVSVSGDTIVVGAWGEDSAATGIDGDQSDNSASSAGAAYVFVRSGTTWSQEAYVKASNTDAGDQFGRSVSISGDTMCISAHQEGSTASGVNGDQSDNGFAGAGAVYVFVRSNGVWTQQAYLKASNPANSDFFGLPLALSGDTIIVGATGEDSNATGVNGNQVDNSVSNAGAAYVFVRSGTTWSQQAYLKASNTGSSFDAFGTSVAIWGDVILVGSYEEDSNATGVNGDQSNNASTNAGAAYVFVRSGTTWSQHAYLKASNTGFVDYFGYSVALSGLTAVCGATQESSNATGVDGDQSNNSANSSGAAYVFVLDIPSGSPFTPFCFGDGGDQMGCTSCPCTNDAPLASGGGCLNSNSTSAVLAASGNPDVSAPADTLHFDLTGGNVNTFGVLISADNRLPAMGACPPGSGIVQGTLDGLRCVGGNVVRHGSRSLDATGSTIAGWGPPGTPAAGIGATAGFIAGQTRHFQCFYRELGALVCMTGQNTSNAVSVTFR